MADTNTVEIDHVVNVDEAPILGRKLGTKSHCKMMQDDSGKISTASPMILGFSWTLVAIL